MRLRGVKRQKSQLELAFTPTGSGEASTHGEEGTETPRAAQVCRGLASTGGSSLWRPGRLLNQPNRRVRTRTHGGVGGAGAVRLPPYPD